MPYISSEERPAIDDAVKTLMQYVKTDGQLNYAISKMILAYVKFHSLRYAHINEIMGVLNCVAHEFYGRVARPYEDKKIKINGDIGFEELDGE